jgi:hypothetical protein
VVYIARLLCPSRHEVLTTAGAYEDTMAAEAALTSALEETFLQAVHGGPLNPWCPFCHSDRLKVEIERTAYRTMEEAAPDLAEILRRLERANNN